MSIGVKLKEMRIKNNKTLQELADLAGVSKAHIWEIEKGGSSNPSMELVKKLANIFKISITEMIGEIPKADENIQVMFREYEKLTPEDQEKINLIINAFNSKENK